MILLLGIIREGNNLMPGIEPTLTEEEVDYVIDKLPGIIEKVTSISPYQKELQALKALKNA